MPTLSDPMCRLFCPASVCSSSKQGEQAGALGEGNGCVSREVQGGAQPRPRPGRHAECFSRIFSCDPHNDPVSDQPDLLFLEFSRV